MTHDDLPLVASLITVRDWLRWATSRFGAAQIAGQGEGGIVFGHGTATAFDEAAFLILATLNLPIDALEPWLDARLVLAERQAIHDVVVRRIETRKPAPYLVNAAYIQGHRFFVDERVIVPRSYLGELLCTGGLDHVLPQPQSPTLHALDLCTGSGCLAILTALTIEDAQVDAVDVSADALEVAARNIKAYDLISRVRLLPGDLFDALNDERYDFILANPPYVAAAEVAAFAPEYAAEPTLAHLGGADGLDLVRRILVGARQHLEDGGVLVMEIGTGRERLEAAFPELNFMWLDSETSAGEVLAIGADELAGIDPRAAAKPQRTTRKG